MPTNFDLFRLNCLLSDNKSQDFNSIISSLVCELLYENKNVELKKSECYNHITEKLKISLDTDVFNQIISKSDNFEISPIDTDSLIKLKSERFSEINEKISNTSIEYYISEYVKEKKLDPTICDKIIGLLYKSVYENINTFSTANISSLIPSNANGKFTNDEILAFNSFLEYDNPQKNNALYLVFSKAIEFAIITSGKGVKKFSKDIFKGKIYLLDTNIIFRLLGVGGEERKVSLHKLLESGIYQGIKFQYTHATYLEFKRKLDQSAKALDRAVERKSIPILEDIYKDKTIQFNDSFTTHYVDCRIKGLVKSPEQYETKLLTDFRLLEKKYDVTAVSSSITIHSGNTDTLKKLLFQKKKEMSDYSRYTNTAANVDATNILYVKAIRGNNNYNYTDVKSFYLTTDRTLNKILAQNGINSISETILPSQLFILHNSIYSEDEEVDFETFTSFLKQRTTNIKYQGSEVLTYIETLRQYTESSDVIKEVLKAHSDKRYDSSLKGEYFDSSIKSFKELAESIMDKRLAKSEDGNTKHEYIKANATIDIQDILKATKNKMRLLDVLITIFIIPVAILCTRLFTKDITITCLSIVIFECIKFTLSTKSPLMKNIWEFYYFNRIANSSYYKLTKDKNYIQEAKLEFELKKGEFWK